MVLTCGNSFKPKKIKDNKQLQVFFQGNTGIFTNHRNISAGTKPSIDQPDTDMEDMKPPE